MTPGFVSIVWLVVSTLRLSPPGNSSSSSNNKNERPLCRLFAYLRCVRGFSIAGAGLAPTCASGFCTSIC